MTAFQVAVCALALFAFVQVSSACGVGYAGNGVYGGYGCGCCDPVVVDVDTFCVNHCGCGYDGCGYGCNGGYGSYGLGGYGGNGGCGGYGGCGSYGGCGGYGGCSGYGGYGCGCGGGYGCGCEPVTEVKTVHCVPVVDTYVEHGCGCGNGYRYGGYGDYGYGY